MLPLYIIFVLFLHSVSSDNAYVYRFCVNELNSNSKAYCQFMQKGNNLVVCVPVTDSVDCALKIKQNQADFGIFTAEEALLASKFINDDVRVIGQLKHKNWINESFSFQTVAVVRENFNGGFPGLQSMNYCHPGFGDGQFWSDRVLKEFEKAVVPRVCQEEYANVQQEVYSVSQYFKKSCRPGQWAMDDLMDKKLKKKFSQLCALCDSPSRCSYNEEVQGSHISALKCLTEYGGDVTYVALQHVKEYFGFIPGHPANARPEEFKFLCPNGATQSLNQPCAWVRQPWPVVVAAKGKDVQLSPTLPTFLCHEPNCRKSWSEAFTLLFEGTSNVFVRNTYGERTLLDIIREGRNIPREWEGDACRRSIRWCTTSMEESEKCEWLKQAVISQDFEPRLSCVASSSIWSCFDLINKKQADIIGIDNDYAFTAENVFNLTSVMYQDNTYNGNYIIVAVVRADSQYIKSLSDLKGKRVCFPEYNGLAWNSFIYTAKSQKILPQVCPSIKAVSSFFKDMCVPGVTDSDHRDYSNVTNSTPINNLCSLCVKKVDNSRDDCEATPNNKYYGDFGAFSCLIGNSSSAIADVAFVDYRRLWSKENEESLKNIKKTDHRILCANGTLVPFPENYNSEFDEKCAFSSGIRAQIVGRRHSTKPEKRDIADLLLKMDDKFGSSIFSFDNIFQMYGPFKGQKGVLFKDTTVDLVTVTDQNNHQVNYFAELKANVQEECQENRKSSSHMNQFNSVILFASFVYVLLT